MSGLDKLQQFVHFYHAEHEIKLIRNLTAQHWQQFGDNCVTQLYNQYFRVNDDQRVFRMSKAYYPKIALLLSKFGYFNDNPYVVRWSRQLNFMLGHYIESLVKMLLIEYGVPIWQPESTLSLFDGLLTGTPDFCVDDAVVDVKSMSGHNYQRFTGRTKRDNGGQKANDNYGYVTQLNLYRSAMAADVNVMYVLAVCKDYPSISLVPIPYYPEIIDGVANRVTFVNECNDLYTGLMNCTVPPLLPARNDTLEVPPQLQYYNGKAVLYELTDQDDEFCKTAIRARTNEEIYYILNP